MSLGQTNCLLDDGWMEDTLSYCKHYIPHHREMFRYAMGTTNNSEKCKSVKCVYSVLTECILYVLFVFSCISLALGYCFYVMVADNIGPNSQSERDEREKRERGERERLRERERERDERERRDGEGERESARKKLAPHLQVMLFYCSGNLPLVSVCYRK